MFIAVHSSIIASLCSKTGVSTPGNKSWLVDLVVIPILRPQFCKDLDLKTGEAVHHLISSMCLNSSSNLSMNFSALATWIFTLISAQISGVLCSCGTFNFVKPSSSNTCEMRNYIWTANCRMYVTTKNILKSVQTCLSKNKTKYYINIIYYGSIRRKNESWFSYYDNMNLFYTTNVITSIHSF